MTYDDMAVANGQAAGLAWESLVGGTLHEKEREAVRKALLEYCGQDTVALLRLLEGLRMNSASNVSGCRYSVGGGADR